MYHSVAIRSIQWHEIVFIGLSIIHKKYYAQRLMDIRSFSSLRKKGTTTWMDEVIVVKFLKSQPNMELWEWSKA